MSHLTRGAWIEIHIRLIKKNKRNVAPHTRCVDWNTKGAYVSKTCIVAPHTRCVDWNLFSRTNQTNHLVAPHTRCVDWNISESAVFSRCFVAPHTRCVDWNLTLLTFLTNLAESHLTRGAWIEIFSPILFYRLLSVAPHTRCVDWNRRYDADGVGILSRTSHEVRGLK